MKKLIYLFLISLLPAITMANNIQISNVTIVNNGPGNIQVEFDLSWENSWRVNVGPNNYDGAWVFFKYKQAGGPWRHITMTAIIIQYQRDLMYIKQTISKRREQ